MHCNGPESPRKQPLDGLSLDDRRFATLNGVPADPSVGSIPDFRAIFQAVPELYLVLTSDLRIVAASDAYLQATMTRREDVLGRHMFDVFPDDPADVGAAGVRNLAQSFEVVLRTRSPHFMAVQKYDIRRPLAEGAVFEERHWAPANFPVLDTRGRVTNIIHRVADVTEMVRAKERSVEKREQLERDLYVRSQEIERANKLLRVSLIDKEALLREIHHRVKNNLQVIASLLRLQAAHVTDPAVRTALWDMGGRVRTIADIHQTLYGSGDLARVDMAEFAEQLIKDLRSLYDVDGNRVRVQLDAAPVTLEIVLAVPYGLILNELVTNAFKHAFPGDRRGTIRVTLAKGDEMLSVCDDGIGQPAGAGVTRTSLGLQLVQLLAEQLGATVEMKSSGGVCVAVSKPVSRS